MSGAVHILINCFSATGGRASQSELSIRALQKALYYIQGFFYAFYRAFLFSEDCEAWVHGPVYRDVYPWLTTRGDLPITAPSDRIIDKVLIGDYFSSVKTKYNMVNPGDIREYAQAMFIHK